MNGKIIFTGIKKEEQLVKAFLNIYHILVEFCKEDHISRVLDREEGIFDFTPKILKNNSPTRKKKEQEFLSKEEEKRTKDFIQRNKLDFLPKQKRILNLQN